MHLRTLRLTIRIRPGLRSRRKTIRMIVSKIHHHFNVSVIEVAGPGSPAESVIGVAALGASRREVREILDRVADAVAAHPRAEVLDIDQIDH